MPEKEKLKVTIHQALQQKVQKQISILQSAIQSLEESRNNETKSSVGDKYETGRAMMQQELFRKQEQLQQALELKMQLTSLDPTSIHTTIQLGSLVKTTQGQYYISVGVGKIILGGNSYFAISTQSPLGKLLIGKQQREEVEFRGKKIGIEEVL